MRLLWLLSFFTCFCEPSLCLFFPMHFLCKHEREAGRKQTEQFFDVRAWSLNRYAYMPGSSSWFSSFWGEPKVTGMWAVYLQVNSVLKNATKTDCRTEPCAGNQRKCLVFTCVLSACTSSVHLVRQKRHTSTSKLYSSFLRLFVAHAFFFF